MLYSYLNRSCIQMNNNKNISGLYIMKYKTIRILIPINLYTYTVTNTLTYNLAYRQTIYKTNINKQTNPLSYLILYITYFHTLLSWLLDEQTFFQLVWIIITYAEAEKKRKWKSERLTPKDISLPFSVYNLQRSDTVTTEIISFCQ